MTFFFKLVKCMNVICAIQLLHYESTMRILCPKPSSFCVKKSSLYPCNIVRILIKLIFYRGCVFLNNYDNVTFTLIICTRHMTINSKVIYLILASLQQSLINISLRLQCQVLILNYLDGKLMIFYHLVGQLVPNKWEHYVTTMLPKVFYFWPLTKK